MKTIKFYTLGCKANQYDTQSIRESFLNKGFQEIFNGKQADVYLINTCTVTASADAKSRNAIRQCIRENSKGKIIVTGCLVEQDSCSLVNLKGIDFIISKKFFRQGISSFAGHTRAFLKIQDGCNNSCSYCKVPLVRGASRSRPLNEIIDEARVLVENGFKEIVLTGICLGAYGRDLKEKTGLLQVIESIENIDGLLRIRLSSIEAGDISDELIDKMEKSKKLCPHLHIPLQSGDDEILKKMKRKYSYASYLNLIQKIKQLIPEIAITTDIMVGFPGEKEENFQNTLKLIRAIVPLKVHIFPYSVRYGTAASNFKADLSPAIVRERISRLKDIARNCSRIYKRQFLNKKMSVLFEACTKDNSRYWLGYTANYIRVKVASDLNLKNKLVNLVLETGYTG